MVVLRICPSTSVWVRVTALAFQGHTRGISGPLPWPAVCGSSREMWLIKRTGNLERWEGPLLSHYLPQERPFLMNTQVNKRDHKGSGGDRRCGELMSTMTVPCEVEFIRVYLILRIQGKRLMPTPADKGKRDRRGPGIRSWGDDVRNRRRFSSRFAFSWKTAAVA